MSLAQPRQLFVNGRRADRAVASSDVVNAFVSPKKVDLEKYTISSSDKAVLKIGNWSKNNVDAIELVFTGQGSPWTESRCTLDKIEKDSILLRLMSF